MPAYDVIDEPNGFRSIQDQDFDNPEDPGVVAGIRPLRQRRRATYVYRAPFQLLLRLEELDAGAVKTILFLATPEDESRTVIWTKMLLHGIGGVADPDADVVAREVAFEEAVLAEDLALQAVMDQPAFPLGPPCRDARTRRPSGPGTPPLASRLRRGSCRLSIDLLLRNARPVGSDAPVDIGVDGGRIVEHP